jgi:hypothetical protein
VYGWIDEGRVYNCAGMKVFTNALIGVKTNDVPFTVTLEQVGATYLLETTNIFQMTAGIWLDFISAKNGLIYCELCIE